MAVATGSHIYNFGNLGCGFVPTTGTQRTYIESVSSNGLQSNGKIEYVVQVSSQVICNNLVWSSASGSISYSLSCGGQSWSTSVSKGCNTGTGSCAGGGCCCCNCNGITYSSGWHTFYIQLSPSATQITACSNWNGNGCTATATYNIPDSMRVTKPNGFSASFPSYVSGGTSCSVSDWGGDSSGTFYVQLLSSSGSVLATNSSSTSSTSKTVYHYGSTSSNSRYRIRAQACNSIGCTSYDYSSYYYTSPPAPSVYINSILYQPGTKKCKVNWSWGKPSDGGYYNETITYDVYDNEGNYYVRGGSLGTATGGAAKSGTLETDGILTAVNLCIKVYVATSAGTSSKTACGYAPVAGAAFLGFEWDDLRRECTVRATAPGARQTRVSGGYAPNNYSIGTKVSSGEFGDLVVKDLNHGTGQILYLEAMPESKDNHQYIDEVAKISIPIPNPILGIKKYPCDSGKKDEYIVDIIEHKTDNTCTPRWQNGDRVVKKGACVAPSGGGVKPVAWYDKDRTISLWSGGQDVFSNIENMGADGVKLVVNPAFVGKTLTFSQIDNNDYWASIVRDEASGGDCRSPWCPDWSFPSLAAGAKYEIWLESDTPGFKVPFALTDSRGNHLVELNVDGTHGVLTIPTGLKWWDLWLTMSSSGNNSSFVFPSNEVTFKIMYIPLS